MYVAFSLHLPLCRLMQVKTISVFIVVLGA